MINLNDIALFIQVVQSGSFAEAGRKIKIPANTVSRRIQELEQQLGQRLMQRSTRKLTLTDAGYTLFQSTSVSLNTLDASIQKIIDTGSQPHGTLRVATPSGFFNFIDIQWVNEFLEQYPKIKIEFMLSDQRADLISDRIDIAFRAGKKIEPGLIARKISSSHAILIASPEYLKRKGTPTSLEDLCNHNCLTNPFSGNKTVWQFDYNNTVEEVTISGNYCADTAYALLEAARAGIGITLLPALFTETYIKSGELVQILPDYIMDKIGVYLVYLSRKQQSLAVRSFIDFFSHKMQIE